MNKQFLAFFLVGTLLITIFPIQSFADFAGNHGPAVPLQDEGHVDVGLPGDKVYVNLFIKNLSLTFCGDDSTNNEITISSSVVWEAANAEHAKHIFEDFGLHEKWKHGETRSFDGFDYDPNLKRGKCVYGNTADCPLEPKKLKVTFFVWECDSWGIWADILKIIAEIVAGWASSKGVPIPTGEIQKWLDKKKAAREDLGYFEGEIPFPEVDPCSLQPGEIRRREGVADLINIYPNWPKDRGERPAVIGKIGWMIEVGKIGPPGSSCCGTFLPPSSGPGIQIELFDFGQHDEAIVSTTLKLYGGIPLSPLVEAGDWLSYEVFFDIDNRTTTGGTNGEEYKLTLSFETMDQVPVARLWAWKNGAFEEVVSGCYDYAISDDRDTVYLSVELEKLGNPVGPIATWAIVKGYTNNTAHFSILPDSAPHEALFLEPNYGFSEVHPSVIRTYPAHGWFDMNRSHPISVEFNKAMNRSNTEAAFSINPLADGHFTWDGNTMIFNPTGQLQPFTNYTVTIDSTATDRVSTPMNYTASFNFFTETLPLYSCTQTGKEQHDFAWKDPIHVTGTYFPINTTVDIHVINHTILEENELIVSENMTTIATNSSGAIPPTLVWHAPLPQFEREYNIIVDINRDGHFQYNIDRIDRMGIGLVLKKHDVAIIDAYPQKTFVGQGFTVNFYVSVRNVGSFNQSFNIIIHNGSLATPDPTKWDIFWGMGDVNRDGYIDNIDADLMATAFGWIGPPGENPADINADGEVNSFDVVILATNIGKDIWTYFGLSPSPLNKQPVMLERVNTTTVSVTWNTAGFAYGNYTIWAYVSPVLNETSTADNTFIDGWVLVTIAGDVNGDRKVDLKDVYAVAKAYGSFPAHPKWNPLCDINNDGKIDLKDYYTTCKNYGKTW